MARTARRRQPADELVSLTDALDELRITRATYYRWRNRGYAPEMQRLPNGHLRISRSKLDAFKNELEIA
ncbi:MULTISPECIES: helix-turn-helix transcriptional regulator [Streptomyces]|uniref:Excisionase n=1 Tax=Streptomyces venezuelae TaxID=54571 RepID=A0A5P2ARJ3_STRVZ|nr:helix-turn-helix domain-containing protein [Streptomyces venezuelae]QES20447.1 excisionase [Streptomyces venezuelae]QES23473.1 excisionase [Streptomyces venezuelae]